MSDPSPLRMAIVAPEAPTRGHVPHATVAATPMSATPVAAASIAAEASARVGSPTARISVAALAPRGTRLGSWMRRLAPLLDRALGISGIDRVYREGGFHDLAPLDFAARAVDVLRIDSRVSPPDLRARIPATGPVLIVANHPYGGVEALTLAAALRGVRDDLRILANGALHVFPELRPLLIPTNPLAVSPQNVTSVRRCERHLRDGGALILFPAGRVSHYQSAEKRVADGEWSRLVGHLVARTGATVVPTYVRGHHGRLFQLLGRIWAPTRMLLLARQLLRQQGGTVAIDVGRPIAPEAWRSLDADSVTRLARLATYLQDEEREGTAVRYSGIRRPLAAPEDPAVLAHEVAALPPSHELLRLRDYVVYHARGTQVPALLRQIALERERVFRALDEGSGLDRDADHFDDTYVQLFVWDHARRALVGAYRLGHTDELLRERGPAGLYLSQMFDFAPEFHRGEPALELGRSFVVSEYQRTFHGLYLLWQGIGRYLVAHPRYGRLYGTVSLSRQFDARATAMVCDALITPSSHVRPRHALRTPLPREWARATAGAPVDINFLGALMRILDTEGKELPVLLRQYYKLGARFHCVGTDPNFLDTPGLLLSVDVRALSPKHLDAFLGPGAATYAASGRRGSA